MQFDNFAYETTDSAEIIGLEKTKSKHGWFLPIVLGIALVLCLVISCVSLGFSLKENTIAFSQPNKAKVYGNISFDKDDAPTEASSSMKFSKVKFESENNRSLENWHKLQTVIAQIQELRTTLNRTNQDRQKLQLTISQVEHSIEDLKKSQNSSEEKQLQLALAVNNLSSSYDMLAAAQNDSQEELQQGLTAAVNKSEFALKELETKVNGGLEDLHNITATVAKLRVNDTDLNNKFIMSQLGQDEVKMQLNQLNDTIHTFHQTPEKKACETGYQYNPHSNTCYRIVNLLKTWPEAKTFCEHNEEYLATFGSIDSLYWFITLRQSNADWQGSLVWVGGQRSVNREWRWYGRLTDPIDVNVWGDDQPDHDFEGPACPNDCDCMANNKDRNYQFTDNPCHVEYRFICEAV